ncbi:MAG: DUF4286 family protein [Cyclobacteriaceae bacterium]
MILYNVTINIDEEKEDEFIEWMKSNHIPKVMNTGLFFEFRFFRLLQENNGDGVNYATQFYAQTLEELERYQGRYAEDLRKEFKDKFGSHFVSFRTVLESVE